MSVPAQTKACAGHMDGKQIPWSWKRSPSLWHKDGKHSPKEKDEELRFFIDSSSDQGKETS